MIPPDHIVYPLDGDKLKVRHGTRMGGNGFGISYDDVCYTLNTVDRHMVAVCALTEDERARM